MADLTEQECEALITWCSNKSAYYGRRSESMASISEFVATGFDSSKTALAIVHCEVEERTQRASTLTKVISSGFTRPLFFVSLRTSAMLPRTNVTACTGLLNP